MLGKRAGLARNFLLTVFAAALAACSQVDTTTNPGDNSSAVPPSITTQPAALSVTEGATATFTVEPPGTTPLSYQWHKKGGAIGGATGASLIVATTASDNGAMYAVTVSNPAGSVQSEAARLTVTSDAVAPTIVAQPAGQSVTAGQT